MKIERIELHYISQELVHPFRTSFGSQLERPCVLVTVYSEGLVGWGECPAMGEPGYSYETATTAWYILHDFLAPMTVGLELNSVDDIPNYAKIRGHQMAKAAIEIALWDLLAQAEGQSLSHYLGGVRDRVEVGVSIGIQPNLQGLLDRVDSFVAEGYQRIKMKIEPGWEVEPLTAVRNRYPDLKLMADANSAFTLADVPLLEQLEPLNLLMIEQPLSHDDIIDHAELQRQLSTPVCLDESIHTPDDARHAIALNACRIINMKVSRVGGLRNALNIHQQSVEAGLQLWCGGMLETGVGRATNLHLATLPNFVLPGDISATDRYYAEDIAEPAFALNREDSTITVPTGPGLGVEVMPERLKKYRQRLVSFTV